MNAKENWNRLKTKQSAYLPPLIQGVLSLLSRLETLGDGFNNTIATLADCPTAPAALSARSLGTEWFLPSIGELTNAC